jgi:O-acetyl-ADP-ribose deacetylase (regulator of RNase III)
MKIRLEKGDITTMHADAIVNAANSSLLGGGGVDGAIHRAAGTELLEACKKLNGCKTGQAKLTHAFLLPAQYVIHCVGPVFNRYTEEEAKRLLYSCYWESLQLAEKKHCASIIFPNISTGIYGFPKQKAAKQALLAVKNFADQQNQHLKKITFCCYDTENHQIYKNLLKNELI